MEEIIHAVTMTFIALNAFPFSLPLPLKISLFLELEGKILQDRIMSHCAFKQAVIPVLSY